MRYAVNDRHRRQAAAYKDARTMQVGAKKGHKGKKAKGKTGPADAKRSKSGKTVLQNLQNHLSMVAVDDGDTLCCLPAELPPGRLNIDEANGAAVQRGRDIADDDLLVGVGLGAAACVVLLLAVAFVAAGMGGKVMRSEYSPKVLMGEPAERIHQRMLGEDPAQEYALPNFTSVMNYT